MVYWTDPLSLSQKGIIDKPQIYRETGNLDIAVGWISPYGMLEELVYLSGDP